MFLTHALRAIYRAAVVTGDSLWKYVSLLLSGTAPAQAFNADASLNNNVLTIVGDTKPSNFNPYTDGYYSNYFDGSGDYLTVPASSGFAFGTGDFTVEGWVYVTAHNGAGANGIFQQGTTSFPLSTTNSVAFGTFSSGQVWQIYANNTNTNSSAAWAFNTWYHFAVVRSSGTTKLYINGVAVITIASDTTNYTGTYFGIGSLYGTGYNQLGYISNLRVVKGTAVYTANFTPPTSPLTAIANTSLLTCQSNRFIDNSINNFAITRTGDVAVRGFAPFTPPTTVNVNTLYSTYFDGSGDWLTLPITPQTSLGPTFTIEAWIYLANTTGIKSIYSHSAAISGAYGYFIFYVNGTNLGFYVRPSTSATETGLVAGTLSATTWTHVAVSVNDTACRLFINGTQVGSTTTVSTTTYTPVYSTVGADIGQGYPLNGYIADLRIVKGTAVYTANFTPPTAPLTAISGTSLLTCQNATLRDNSTNALAITSYGQVQPVAISPFTQVTTPVTATYLGSTYLDGTGDYLSLAGNTAYRPGTGDFTLECWVYNTTSGTQIFYLVDQTNGFSLYRNASNNLIIAQDNVAIRVTSSATIPVNAWSHIAASRSGTTTRLFIDGVLTGSATDSSNYTGTGSLFIGSQSGGTSATTGYISDVRIIKGTALYTANFAPPAQPLTAVANTSLLTLQTDQHAANKQFIDNSGSNLIVTQAGNATQGSFSPYGANWSNYFDGTGDYLNVSNNTAFTFTSDFTIECWVYGVSYQQSNAAYPTIFSTSAYDSAGIGLKIQSSGGVGATGVACVWNNGSQILTGTTVISNNNWYHLAISRSGTSMKLFVNGVAENTITNSTTFTVLAGYPLIGGDTTIAGFLTGSISNLRIVKGTAVYTAAFTPPTAPLTAIANTSLLTCQSPTIVDNSPNAFAITRNGNVSVQRFSPFNPVIQTPISYSTYFDGSGDYLSIASSTSFGFGTGDFTIEFWAYSTSTSRQDWVDISDGTNRVLFYYTGSAVTFYGNGVTAITGAALVTNAWVHYAVVKSSGSTKLYVNGTQAGSTYATNQNYGTTAAVSIGKDMFGSTYITGNLSNFRIVKGTAVYTANFTPPTAPLTAISGTSLLTCQSATIVDNSSNAFAITTTGDARARTQNPFGFTNTTTGVDYTPALYGGSAYFDGTGDTLNLAASAALPGAGDFTIDFWLNLPTAPTGGAYFTAFAYGSSGSVLRCFIFDSSGVKFGIWIGASQIVNVASTAMVGQWAHIGMSRKGTSFTFYINGVLIATVTDSTNYNTGTLYVASQAGSSFLPGYISDFRIIVGQALYTGGFVPPIAPLQAVQNTVLLLNMDKSGITDSSRCVDLETVGDAKIRYETPYNGSYYSNYFDGSGDYLSVPSNAALNFGTGDFTIEAWVNPRQLSVDWFIISASGSGGLFFGYAPSSSGYGWGRAAVAWDYQPATTATLDTWQHVALTRSGTSMRLFVNGVQQGTTQTNSIAYDLSVTSTTIGSQGANYYVAGLISNLRVVKGTAVYTANFTPPTAPLTAIANTSLLTCQSKSLVDNSSNNFTITRNGDVAVKSMNPFQGVTKGSMYFDGTGDYLTAPNNGAFDFSTGDFTVEAWVYTNGTQSQYANIVCQGSTAANTWYLSFGTSNTVTFSNFSTNFLVSSSGVANNTWTHVAVSRSGTSLKMFLNGVQTASATNSSTLGATATLFVGFNNGASYFNGYIADLRITKAARYTANFTPPTAPLPTA